MKKAYSQLEINQVIDKFKKYLKTTKAIEKINNLQVFNDKKTIKKEYFKLQEMYQIFENYGDLPIYSKLNLSKEIDNLKKGNLMEGIKLLDLKDELVSIKELILFYKKIDFKIPYTQYLFIKLSPLDDLINKISSSIDRDGSVLDHASPTLAKVRKQIEESDKKLRITITNIFQKNKDIVNGDNYVIRNNRLVIPIDTNKKKSLLGIVQDVSDSGGTTFIEPFEIAEIENEKSVLLIKERDEINRILSEFRTLILFNESNLIFNNNCISEIDFLVSKVKYMKEFKASIPTINDDYSFNLINARHPLISNDVCVPNTFKLDQNKTLMLISGPNAGGKTIALKTVATLSYLAKLALPLTVEEGSSICIFNNIYVDIGDDQSLENNLSTFSSHISNLSNISKNLSKFDFVILDELCSGTDPKEGEALSIAITKKLLEIGCLSMISSHYHLLKKFCLSQDNVLNASFLFDEKHIKPTFKLLTGVSGKSYGFLVANKYGISKEIIEEAESIYKENYLNKIDIRIEQIEDKERQLAFKEERLNKFENKLSKEQSNIDIQKNKLKEKEDDLKEKKIEDFDRFLDEKYREIDIVYQEFVKEKNTKKALDKLAAIELKNKEKQEFHQNDYVKIKTIGATGQIIELKGNKATIVTADGFKIVSNLENLDKTNAPRKEIKSEITNDDLIINRNVVSSSINLIGYRVDEAVNLLDNFISNSLIAKHSLIKVIHGFGTGRLRQGIWAALKQNPHVESFELGSDVNGGGGTTIVRLK